MKPGSVAALCILFSCSALHSAETAGENAKTIPVDDLSRLKVIGKLGIPLGKLVEIKGIIIAKGSLGGKQIRSYCLEITSVSGRDLEKTVTLPIRSPSGISLPNNWRDLHQFKKGYEAKGMTEELIKDIEKDYVGSEVRFLGFESGSFKGLPDGVTDPEAWTHPIGSPSGFYFESEIVPFSEI